MAVSSEEQLKHQLVTAVNQALGAQQVDGSHCLLIRFYSDLNTVNSKAYQANIAAGATPSREDLVNRAALHMFAGQTEGSYFISFSADIETLVKAISEGPEVSWAVRSIIQGSKPELYGQPMMEKIALPPAKFVGIFKVNKGDIVRWDDPALLKAVQTLISKDRKYMDLKMNFQKEHEVVAYYPGQIEAPVATIDNPFYAAYMDKIKK